MENRKDDELSESEIAIRMNNAVRRALNTPPKPLKEMLGQRKRAAAKPKSRPRKARRSDPKSP
jgi:hypothetical protein